MVLLSGCGVMRWLAGCPSPCPNTDDGLRLSVERAARALRTSCFPSTFDRDEFLRRLHERSTPAGKEVTEADLGNLHTANLKVWTASNCQHYYLVARRTPGGQAILWDDSATTEVDSEKGPIPEGALPRQSQANCQCNNAPANPGS
jgi:hypothetical protein